MNVDVRDFGDDESTKTSEKQPRKRGLLGWLGELAFIFVTALVISSLLRAFIFQVFEIPSGSMENTLQVGDRVVSIKVGSFERGDIVVFADPADWLPPNYVEVGPVQRGLEFIGLLPSSSTRHLIKRVIGMPGDRVTCCSTDGRLSVNGVALDETSYLYTASNGVQVAPSDLQFDITVPAGRIFVMGDHRNASGDSRVHLCDPGIDGLPQGMTAFVPIEDVVGPAAVIIAPLNRLTRLTVPATFADVPAAVGDPPANPSIVVAGNQC